MIHKVSSFLTKSFSLHGKICILFSSLTKLIICLTNTLLNILKLSLTTQQITGVTEGTTRHRSTWVNKLSCRSNQSKRLIIFLGNPNSIINSINYNASTK